MITDDIQKVPGLDALLQQSGLKYGDSGIVTFDGMESFVADAQGDGLAQALWEKAKFSEISDALSGGNSFVRLWDAAPENMRSLIGRDESDARAYFSEILNLPENSGSGFDAVTLFAEEVARQAGNNAFAANLRSIVALGYQSCGWTSDLSGAITGAFSDLQNISSQIGQWKKNLASQVPPEALQAGSAYLDFLLNDFQGLFDPSSSRESLNKLLTDIVPSTVALIPVYGWIIAGIYRAGLKVFEAVKREHEGRENLYEYNDSAAGVTVLRWEDEGEDYNLMFDVENLNRVMRDTQSGNFETIFSPPPLGDIDTWGYNLIRLKSPDHEMNGRHIRSIFYTGPDDMGLRAKAVPGSSDVVTGGYLTAPGRSKSDVGSTNSGPLATGSRPGRMGGYCDAPVFEVASFAKRTSSYTTPLWQMINGKSINPSMFTIDAELLRGEWENFVQRQFELYHAFSSGFFCQSNLVVPYMAYSGAPGRIVGPGQYRCDTSLSKGESGFTMNREFMNVPSSFPSVLDKGEYNYFRAQCNEEDERFDTITMVKGVSGKGPSDMFEYWKQTGFCSKSRPYNIAGVGSGMVLSEIYRQMLPTYFGLGGGSPFDESNDFWLTHNLNRDGHVYKYGSFNKKKILRSAFDGKNDHRGAYAALNWSIPESGTYKSGSKCKDRTYTSGRFEVPPGHEFYDSVRIWQYYPHPDAIDYSKSIPAKALLNLQQRQLAAVLSGHPILWSVDPDNPTFSTFRNSWMKSAWQKSINEMLQAPAAYLYADVEDIPNPQLRNAVEQKQKDWIEQSKYKLMPKPAPLRRPVVPNPNPVINAGGIRVPADPIDSGSGSSGGSTARSGGGGGAMLLLAAVAAGAVMMGRRK